MKNPKSQISIDIIIPSFRTDFKVLSSIINLKVPDKFIRQVIVICDNPHLQIDSETLDLFKRPDVIFIRNKENLGASASRNVGIDKSESDWILFLDDDIEPNDDLLEVYLDSILKNGNKIPGFVGVTTFPPSVNNFTKGIISSQILTFFDLAKKVEHMPWGITANLLINRNNIQDIRFKDTFPKAGGGEDIDFCLEICKSLESNFISEPRAVVKHPWWLNGKRSYKRFFRWAYGDSQLPLIHKEHKYRNFPNSAELLSILLICSILLYFSSISFMIFSSMIFLSIILGDWFTEWLKIYSNSQKLNPIIAIESSLIRFSNDLGRLSSIFLSLNIFRITERFDYAATGDWISGERKWAFFKIISQIIICFTIFIAKGW